MADELVQPRAFFFDRFGLDESALERVLGTATAKRADDADLEARRGNAVVGRRCLGLQSVEE